MKRKERATRTFYRYAAGYFAILFLLSALVFLFVLRYSSNRVLGIEKETALQGMQQVADSVEKQFQTLENIAIKIGTAAAYQPNMITRGPIFDIDLLTHFQQYANYSPLAEQYFLTYRGTDKIYLSTGYTSYFNIYAEKNLGILPEMTASLRETIDGTATQTVEYAGDAILLICPIRFSGISSLGGNQAALCFVIGRNQIGNYIGQVSAGLPEKFALTSRGMDFFISDSFGTETTPDGRASLQTSSSRGKVLVRAVPQFSGWQAIVFQNQPLFYIMAAAVLLGAAAVAFLMARFSLRPLEKLIRKYTPGSEKVKNDFRELDGILENMENRHSSAIYQLRNHYLILLLRGDYSEKLERRWAMLDVNFRYDTCCVFLIENGAAAPLRDALGQALEEWQHPQIQFYTAEMEEDTNLIVIANYDHTVSAEEVLGRIRAVVNKEALTVYAGKPTDSPKRLPLSFMAALTARQYGLETAKKAWLTPDSLAEEILSAAINRKEEAMQIACGRIKAYLSEDEMDSVLTKHRFYELMRSILHYAEERRIDLPKSDINALVLLPDPGLIADDLRKIMEKADLSQHVQETAEETTTLIVEYIIANAYDPDINLQDMSAKFGLSADYISAIVKRETGSAFKEYVTMLRISEARRLLMADKSLTVNEVSERVGYRKASNFSKKFKELTGVLPSQIR